MEVAIFIALWIGGSTTISALVPHLDESSRSVVLTLIEDRIVALLPAVGRCLVTHLSRSVLVVNILRTILTILVLDLGSAFLLLSALLELTSSCCLTPTSTNHPVTTTITLLHSPFTASTHTDLIIIFVLFVIVVAEHEITILFLCLDDCHLD